MWHWYGEGEEHIIQYIPFKVLLITFTYGIIIMFYDIYSHGHYDSMLISLLSMTIELPRIQSVSERCTR